MRRVPHNMEETKTSVTLQLIVKSHCAPCETFAATVAKHVKDTPLSVVCVDKDRRAWESKTKYLALKYPDWHIQPFGTEIEGKGTPRLFVFTNGALTNRHGRESVQKGIPFPWPPPAVFDLGTGPDLNTTPGIVLFSEVPRGCEHDEDDVEDAVEDAILWFKTSGVSVPVYHAPSGHLGGRKLRSFLSLSTAPAPLVVHVDVASNKKRVQALCPSHDVPAQLLAFVDGEGCSSRLRFPSGVVRCEKCSK